MSVVRVVAGLQAARTLPATRLIIAGQRRHVEGLDFENDLRPRFGATPIDESAWRRALRSISEPGDCSVLLNDAKLLLLPDSSKASRVNTPTQAVELSKLLRSAAASMQKTKEGDEAERLSVLLFCSRPHAAALVAAVTRCFSTYSRKSDQNVVPQVDVEVVVQDGEPLNEKDVDALSTLANAIQKAAFLVDQPANELTTDAFVQVAKEWIQELSIPNVAVRQIRGEELREQGFGGIYNVGKAGPQPPSLLVFSINGDLKSDKSVALVGKGVVFDTGGMQLKPPTGMLTMKHDMGGAAAVLGAFGVLARSGFPDPLHLVLCIVENNISPAANKPDDVIRLLSGRTVEINNTDAEGRLILADGVCFARRDLAANLVVDVATLTGAQAYATGRTHAAVLANGDGIERRALSAGRRSGELVHALPFAPELHFGDLKSEIADMKNTIAAGKNQGPPSAVAGLFIGKQINFGQADAKKSDVDWTCDWLHVDMASLVAVNERATGFGVGLLCSLLGDRCAAAGTTVWTGDI